MSLELSESDATIWRVVNYAYKVINYAPRVVTYAPRKTFIVQPSLMRIII